MNKAKEGYLRRAVECLAFAATARDPEERVQLLVMAGVFHQVENVIHNRRVEFHARHRVLKFHDFRRGGHGLDGRAVRAELGALAAPPDPGG